MAKERCSEYVVGQRPPSVLTNKANRQLDRAKPSPRAFELAKVARKLISKSPDGGASVEISVGRLRTSENVTKGITAKTAATRAFLKNPDLNKCH